VSLLVSTQNHGYLQQADTLIDILDRQPSNASFRLWNLTKHFHAIIFLS
jgi:hypothetical protein